jgi:hypothetical protein
VKGAFVESDRPWDVESRGLDVTGCETSAHLCLIRTRFQDAPVFRGAGLARIDFGGSALPGFAGDGLSLRHGISFARCVLAGPVRLLGCRAGSSVVFDEASIETAEAVAIQLERAEVGGSVLLRDGFFCNGTIRLYNAKVDGNVEGREGRIAGRNGVAMNGEGLRTVGSVLLRDGFQADGSLRFYGARIGRDFDLSGSRLAHASEDAISAISADIKGRLLMRSAQVAGTVALGGAKVGGEIVLEGARLSKPAGYALAANGLDVHRGIHVNAETELDGGVTLVGASAGYLDHQPDIWPCAAKVRLNRFSYSALLGRVTAGSCIRWLD